MLFYLFFFINSNTIGYSTSYIKQKKKERKKN